MVESYLRTRLVLLLDGMLQCLEQGDEESVDLESADNPPVTGVDMARSLSKAMDQPDNVRTVYYERPGERPHRFAKTEWSIGPWVFKAGHGRVVVQAKEKPSAHTILTATTVRDTLQRMDTANLPDTVYG